MEANTILTANVLDIIFEGRNKEYGAYELRKTYNQRLIIAVGVMAAVCLLFVFFLMMNSTESKKASQLIVDGTLVLKSLPNEHTPPPIPPPIKHVKPVRVEMKKLTPPTLVKENVEPPPTQSQLNETAIGPIDQSGIKGDFTAPPVEQSTGVAEAPKKEIDYNSIFHEVQIEAQFPGGIEAWNKYLQRNLRSESPMENGAPVGSYTVMVSFLVDKEGNISDVKAENDPGYGTAQEAVRVIQRGPKWIPAVQNGRNVIYRQRQSITFKVLEQ